MKVGGRILCITGPMYAGKSTELARQLRRHEFRGRRVFLLVPSCDTRYDASGVSLATHDGYRRSANAVIDSEMSLVDFFARPEHAAALAEADVIGLEEASFMKGLVAFCDHAASVLGKTVIVCGLLMTAEKSARTTPRPEDRAMRPFGEMLRLSAIAEKRITLSAVCVCSANAHFCVYVGDAGYEGDVLVGNAFDSVCRACLVRFRAGERLVRTATPPLSGGTAPAPVPVPI